MCIVGKMNRSKLEMGSSAYRLGKLDDGHNFGARKHHNIELCNIIKQKEYFSAPYQALAGVNTLMPNSVSAHVRARQI